MTASAEVLVDHPAAGVAVLTYRDPARRNHLSFEGSELLRDAVRDARDGGHRVVVVAGDHPQHWIQHMWLPDLVAVVDGGTRTGHPMAVFSLVEELVHPDLVTIAAIDGDTAGGGCELGWACDLRVAGDGARFAQPEIQLDLTPGLGGASRLQRLIGPTATAAMVLDGRPVEAAEIHRLGGVNRLVPAGSALEVAVAWAADIAGRGAPALRAAKLILREAEDLPLGEALANEQRHFQSVLGDAVPAMRAAQERLDDGTPVTDLYRSSDEER